VYFRSGLATRLDRAPKFRIQILISFSLSFSLARVLSASRRRIVLTPRSSLSLSLSLSLSFSLCCERKERERVKNERAIDGEDRTARRADERKVSLASTNSREGRRSVNRTSSVPPRRLSPILYLSRYLALSPGEGRGATAERLPRRQRIAIQSRRDPIDLPARARSRWSPMTARADIADFPETHLRSARYARTHG